MGTKADMTVFRKLAPLDHLTSYSHRGSYYTLRSLPRFDDQGIWLGRGAWFSRQGTLLDTIPALVNEATAGYLAAELETVLHVPVKDALRQLTLARRVHREDFQGLYLYAAQHRTRRQEQLAARRALGPGADAATHQARAAMVLFYSLLDEQQRRLYAGMESLRQGHGGDRQLAERLGLDAGTVARGRRELMAGQVQRQRVRRAGSGRPRAGKKRPLS
ncbi:MAG TPA: hypothetical protein VHZ32_14785 [Rhizomicrobium sp.]|nr:hypothetical protein [Rhizomicrobium sp.]